MLGLFLLTLLGCWVVFYQKPMEDTASATAIKVADKLEKLWDIAHESLKDKHYLRAEKALLTILRVDERNATAYNRLGILYAKQRAYQDAIECFEIAQSLEPSASSLHNVGLIYFETEQYEKAALAFEQALALQDDVAARHIAYAKVQEKLGHGKKMIAALRKAIQLEPSVQGFNMLADAYDQNDQADVADRIRIKLKEMAEQHSQEVPKAIAQPPRKVVM